MEENDLIKIKYEFLFKSKNLIKKYEVNFEKRSLILELDKNVPKARWMELDFKKCSICPLDGKNFKYCPRIDSALYSCICTEWIIYQ